jgi:hypothetical protein
MPKGSKCRATDLDRAIGAFPDEAEGGITAWL